MGYTTEFDGYVEIVPPLSEAERDYINKFSETRRMNCVQGPYYVDRGGFAGQDDGSDVIDYNCPPPGQPELWCKWIISEDGSRIEWDGREKFYSAERWMAYIIDHFLRPGSEVMKLSPSARAELNIPDFTGHVCNGIIHAQGEERGDVWVLAVRNNRVGVQSVQVKFDPDGEIEWQNGESDLIEPPTADLPAIDVSNTDSPILALGVRLGAPRTVALQYFADNAERLIGQIGLKAAMLLGSALTHEAEGVGKPWQAYKFAEELVPGIVIRERPDLVAEPGWSAASATGPWGADCVKIRGGLGLAFILVAINVWEATHAG